MLYPPGYDSLNRIRVINTDKPASRSTGYFACTFSPFSTLSAVSTPLAPILVRQTCDCRRQFAIFYRFLTIWCAVKPTTITSDLPAVCSARSAQRHFVILSEYRFHVRMRGQQVPALMPQIFSNTEICRPAGARTMNLCAATACWKPFTTFTRGGCSGNSLQFDNFCTFAFFS